MRLKNWAVALLGIALAIGFSAGVFAKDLKPVNDVPPKPTGANRYVTDLGELIPDEDEPAS